MVGASKILTVSYGTFSCTLEGFDEPFNTMKAIAEYFRDLAAEDRYFGAEPPTPDTEMLHRIAEREIQRRVDAKIEANGIVLRPRHTPEDTPLPAPAESAHAMTAPKAEAPVKPQPSPVVNEAPAAQAQPAVEVDPISESVAAKLQRIRAAVAQARAAAAAAPAFEEDEQSDVFEAEETEAPEEFGYELDLSGPLLTDDSPAVADEAAPEAEDAAESEEPAIEVAASDADEVEEEEAAVETAAEEDDVDTLEWDDDTGEAAPVRRAESVVERRRASRRAARAAALAAAAADLVEAQANSDDVAADVDENETAFAAPELNEQVEVAPEEEAVAQEVTEFEDEVEEDSVAEVEIEVEVEAEDDTPVAEESHDADDLAALLAASLSEDNAADAVEAAVDSDEDQAEAPAKLEPLILAHVVKVPRNDDDTAERVEDANDAESEVVEADPLLMLTDPQTADVDADATVPSALSNDAEADLMRELASLETAPVADAPAAEADAESWADNFEEDDELGRLLSGMTDSDVTEADSAIEEDSADAEDEPVEEIAEIEAVEVAETEEAEEGEIVDTVDEDADAAETDVDDAEPEATPVAASAASDDEGDGDAREADVSRLLEETNTKLEGAENRRRFSAIAHLKAAVAATVADRLVRGTDRNAQSKKEEEATEAYRDDLTRAVHPRRPVVSGEAHTLRPSLPVARPAPLMLVSEQRIDRSGEDGGAAVVRPRRIAASRIAARHTERPEEDEAVAQGPISAEDARSFAEFAESLGSSGLSELLEAAAAYTSTIEGRPHFSPPQILRKVASVADEGDFSREESLRSFGQLLRQGKIAKIRRGQYAITEQSRFFEDSHRAAN